MTFQVLVSAMHLADYSLIDELNITSDVVLINQCDRQERVCVAKEDDRTGRSVLFLSNTERGLSKSRNLAIREASSDLCIFCDNDVVYEEGYERTIVSAFEDNPDADIIVFFIERPERGQPIFDRVRPLGYKGAMKIFSPEIAFRRDSLYKYSLKMNESFGAGAEYGMGEENIFLFEALEKGMKVIYVPVKIAHLMETQSTWFKGYTDKFFVDRGAGYYAMSKRWYLLLILQFAIRKRKLYRADNSFFNCISCMLKGAKEYSKKVRHTD